MTESKRKRIVFESLFLPDEVTVKQPKLLQAMTWALDRLAAGEDIPVTELYDYCVGLWSLVEFLRAHPDLRTTVPLEFVAHKIACNCYWWEVITRTDQYAACVAKMAADKDTASLVALMMACRQALGLLRRLGSEALPEWSDRGKSAGFATELEREIKSSTDLHKQVWLRALGVGAQVLGDKPETAQQSAQMHATIFQLTGKEDTIVLGRGLLVRSIHLHYTGQYGMAIAVAQAYEKVNKGVVHPHLESWLKSNAAVWKQTVPPPLDGAEALMAAGTTTQYYAGAAPPRLVLFELKKT